MSESPVPRNRELGLRAAPPVTACQSFSAALASLEDEEASPSRTTARLLRHSRLLTVRFRPQLRSPRLPGRGARRAGGGDVHRRDAGKTSQRPRDPSRAHAQCVSAERARLAATAAAQRRCQALRLRSGGAGREGGRWWQRRRLLKRRRRRGSGGRCFCQFRLFVREVDPPLPEHPGGSCGSRGQHRPRPLALASPARHGPGLRPPLQAAHYRRQR